MSVPDVMRRVYQPISDQQKADADMIKAHMNETHALLSQMQQRYKIEGGRELAVALTNLEQASMWAVKGITATP